MLQIVCTIQPGRLHAVGGCCRVSGKTLCQPHGESCFSDASHGHNANTLFSAEIKQKKLIINRCFKLIPYAFTPSATPLHSNLLYPILSTLQYCLHHSLSPLQSCLLHSLSPPPTATPPTSNPVYSTPYLLPPLLHLHPPILSTPLPIPSPHCYTSTLQSCLLHSSSSLPPLPSKLRHVDTVSKF